VATFYVTVDYLGGDSPGLIGSRTQNVSPGDTIIVDFRGYGPEDLDFGSNVNCSVTQNGSSPVLSGGTRFTVSSFVNSAYSCSFSDDEGDSWPLQGSVATTEVYPAFPTASDQTVPSTTTSVTVSISGGQAGDAYSLCKTSGLTTNPQVVADRIGSYIQAGGSFVIPDEELPAAGSSKTYYIYSYRFAAYGGAQQYYEGNSFTVTRSAPAIVAPASPTANNQTVPSTTTSVTVPISGGIAIEEAYSLCVTPGLTTNVQVVNDRIDAMTPYNGVGDVFTISSGEMPAIGSSRTYYIYSYRYTAYGGAAQYYYASSFTVTRSAPAIVAPVISSVSHNNAALASVTATVNLSSAGSGGTLEYAQSTTNSVPSTGWQSSASFSHPRGTVRYYWASQNRNTSGFSSSASLSVGYLVADTVVAATSSTISVSATTATTTVSGVDRTSEEVAVRVNNGSTNLGTRTGNGTITFSSSLPSAGNIVTYEIFTRRPTSTGGDGVTWYGTNDTFTVTRGVADTTPDAFDLGGPETGAPLNTFIYSNTITVSGITSSASVSISGTGSPAYSIGGGTYTSSSGTVVNNDQVQVRVTSAGTTNTAVTATLNIGGVTDTFSVTTTTSTGGGTTPGNVDYGLEVTGPDGSTTVFGPNYRVCNIAVLDAFSLSASQVLDIPCDSAQDANKVAIIVDTGSRLGNTKVTVTRQTNNIRLTNTATTSYTGDIIAIRIG
jgi:hypothetical protein